MFNYHTIFYMRYSPIGLGKLPIFDQLPLVLPLLIRGPTFIGINLHWIPGPLRYKFCLLIQNIFQRYPDNQKERFHLWYQMLKTNPALSFSLMGLRKYYIARCMNVIEIPGEQWNDLPLLSTNKFRARYLQMVSSANMTY